MSAISIGDFLLARYDEEETSIQLDLEHFRSPLDFHIDKWVHSVMIPRLEDLKGKRMVVEWHNYWPVLMTGPMEFENIDPDPMDLNRYAVRARQHIEWVTQKQYIDRFGTDPPTAPILMIMAQQYFEHPDFNPNWRMKETIA